MVNSTGISRQTLDLANAFVKINNAQMELSSVAKDLGNEYKITRSIREWANRLAWIQGDFKRIVVAMKGREQWDVIQSQLVNDEDTLQMKAIADMMLHLPKGIRDDIEKYVESRYNIYSLNDK